MSINAVTTQRFVSYAPAAAAPSAAFVPLPTTTMTGHATLLFGKNNGVTYNQGPDRCPQNGSVLTRVQDEQPDLAPGLCFSVIA